MEISQFELGLSKSTLVTEMAERERQHYHEEQHQIEDNIALSQEELETLARDLEGAKQERANKIEYDQLATQVLQFPSRESSQQSIAQLNAEILELENEATQQSQLMDLRKKQFFTALLCLQSTQESIREDRREEEKRLYLKRSHNDLDDHDEDDEGGFVENMEGVVALDSEHGRETPHLTPALERVISHDGHGAASPNLNRSRRESSSPGGGGVGGAEAAGGTSGGADGEVFMLDLQPNTPRGGASAGTPGRTNHPATPTPPTRSLTGTPNPADK
jgi:hypothetical protein